MGGAEVIPHQMGSTGFETLPSPPCGFSALDKTELSLLQQQSEGQLAVMPPLVWSSGQPGLFFICLTVVSSSSFSFLPDQKSFLLKYLQTYFSLLSLWLRLRAAPCLTAPLKKCVAPEPFTGVQWSVAVTDWSFLKINFRVRVSLYGSVVGLHCWVSFRCRTQRFSDRYIHLSFFCFRNLTFGWDGPSWRLLTALKLLRLEAEEL